ncbi:MAG: PhoX family protein [Acidimicrobiales bacterium]
MSRWTSPHPEPEGERDDLYGSGADFAALVGRYSRRQVLRAGFVLSAALVVPACGPSESRNDVGPPTSAGEGGRLSFAPVPPGHTDELVVPEGYGAYVLLGWGDPLFSGDELVDPRTLSAADQQRRFGYNNDFLAFLPLGASAEEGLLWVNHESTAGAYMFAGYDAKNPTRDQVDVEMAAHGGTVVHLLRARAGAWVADRASRYTRRITATTPMAIAGPAAGHRLMKTSADPDGRSVLGMLNNCSGGTTPWGTVLTAEENISLYFGNQAQVSDAVLKSSHERYGMAAAQSSKAWERYEARFDLAREPNEANRFGWIVEIDPADPGSTPVKRTALGRMKHEAATVVLSRHARVVVYMGDDERFEYAYKYVSDGGYVEDDRARNAGLLDAGTLHVARFDDDGRGEWIPLRHSDPRLEPAFDSQAELLIRTREAADRLGATKMDRPEDIETNPATGRVYLVLTANPSRVETAPPDRPGTGVDAANPRANNRFGHIIEIREDGNDPAATGFKWSMFMLCGPKDDTTRTFAGFPPDQVSDIAGPDNLVFDKAGNMWIATDGQGGAIGQNDSLQAVATSGAERGKVTNFLTAPTGAEVTGPCLVPDESTLLVSIQHPGAGGDLNRPLSQWPDSNGYPRPAVVVVRRFDGARIGS